MTDTARIRRRRRNLLAVDPRCYWCRREVRDYDIPQPTEAYPADMATIDHLNSLIKYPGGRPSYMVYSVDPGGVIRRVWATRLVLSCPPCNGERARDEERGVDWTPGCRAVAEPQTGVAATG
jgi:hypothetical protein